MVSEHGVAVPIFTRKNNVMGRGAELLNTFGVPLYIYIYPKKRGVVAFFVRKYEYFFTRHILGRGLGHRVGVPVFTQNRLFLRVGVQNSPPDEEPHERKKKMCFNHFTAVACVKRPKALPIRRSFVFLRTSSGPFSISHAVRCCSVDPSSL